MMFNKSKIALFWIVSVIVYLSSLVYSQNVTLSLASDKPHYDINENIDLILTIKADQQVNAGVVSIKWVDQFDIVSQSNWTNIENINWAVNVLNQLKISLSAKAAWEYVIWPAQTQIWSWIKESNTITISVSWEKMFIGNSAPNYVNSTTPPVQQTNADSVLDEDKKKSLLPFIIAVLLLAVALVIVKIRKSKNAYTVSSQAEWNQSQIVFPKIDDPKFTSKITKVLNLILQKILWKSVDSMTYSEIKKLQSFKSLDDDRKSIIDQIFNLLALQKYSNSEIDRKDLLKMIKKI